MDNTIYRIYQCFYRIVSYNAFVRYRNVSFFFFFFMQKVPSKSSCPFITFSRYREHCRLRYNGLQFRSPRRQQFSNEILLRSLA